MSTSYSSAPSSTSSSSSSSSSHDGNGNDSANAAGPSSVRGGGDLEGPSSSRRRSVNEVWPEPFVEALAAQVAIEASRSVGRLAAAPALANVSAPSSTSSSSSSSSSHDGNGNDSANAAGPSSVRGGGDLEGPSSSRRRSVNEVWPEPFVEALAAQVAIEASRSVGRLAAAPALANVFQSEGFEHERREENTLFWYNSWFTYIREKKLFCFRK
ncbi:hypothetical protein C1H46_031367 [Malus baccata]|uniref:Uncharacterized protein n=1 Tax=Malus baccata TaxID=106549 RepID=A0A540L994_MALBA|nr:hypothetical protein C1H46_031367 [Malus baccata]